MKSKPYFLLMLLFGIMSCKNEVYDQPENQKQRPVTERSGTECPGYFYYYLEQRVELGTALTDKMIIGFPSGTALNVKESLIKKHDIVTSMLSQQENAASDFLVVSLKPGSTCEEVEQVMSGLQKDESVLYATPFLQVQNDRQVVGITNEFLVTLSDSATYSDLQTLAEKTKTQILENFGAGTYILSATKRSEGNALEMANFFHQQAEIKMAEPNFYIQLKD